MSGFARQLLECEEEFQSAQGDNDIREALECFEKARAEAKEPRELCSALTMLGYGNFKLGNYSIAIEYFLECADIATKDGDLKRRLRAIEFVRHCYQRQGMTEQAKHYEQLTKDIMNNLV